jgi:hypothetical protein
MGAWTGGSQAIEVLSAEVSSHRSPIVQQAHFHLRHELLYCAHFRKGTKEMKIDSFACSVVIEVGHTGKAITAQANQQRNTGTAVG